MNDAMPLPAPMLREVPRFEAKARFAAQRRPLVLVLGMHRSGTSLCSHVLSALGVDMTDKVAGPGSQTLSSDNARGHWERWEIVDFHDRIFGLFNQGYYSPLHDFELPVAWWADPQVVKTRREMVTFLEKRMGPELFGFKDPRSVRLMPLWHQITKELKLTPKIIYCLRNPAQVARSLHSRDRLSLDLGEYRWFSYNMDFFRFTKGAEICTIEYESWFEDYRINLDKLRTFLELTGDQPEFDLDSAVSEIVDSALRHDDRHLADARQPLIRTVYKSARRADQDTAARTQIHDIAIQFLTFQQLQRALRQEFEQVSSLAARVPVLDQRVAVLEASLSEREAQLGAMTAQAQENASRASDALAALERQRAMNGELIERGSVLEAELAEQKTAAEGMRAEMARMGDALGAAEIRVLELERIRGQIADLREAVAQVEREAEEQRASEAAVRNDIANALQAARRQVAMLQSELGHAREAGRAALRALAPNSLGERYREPRLGWRQALRRVVGFAALNQP
jgi:hypothetical protein